MSIEEINLLHERILVNRTEYEQQRQALAAFKEQLDQDENRLLVLMESAGLKSYKGAFGQVVVTHRFNVKLPATPDDWTALWKYLEERGHAEALKTINYQRLNGWYKEELERAKERGDLDWQPPGLAPPTTDTGLSFRK